MPSLKRRGSFGSHHVEFFVEVPKRLTERQKELLRQYAETFEDGKMKNSHPIRESFFQKIMDRLSCIFSLFIL